MYILKVPKPLKVVLTVLALLSLVPSGTVAGGAGAIGNVARTVEAVYGAVLGTAKPIGSVITLDTVYAAVFGAA